MNLDHSLLRPLLHLLLLLRNIWLQKCFWKCCSNITSTGSRHSQLSTNFLAAPCKIGRSVPHQAHLICVQVAPCTFFRAPPLCFLNMMASILLSSSPASLHVFYFHSCHCCEACTFFDKLPCPTFQSSWTLLSSFSTCSVSILTFQ